MVLISKYTAALTGVGASTPDGHPTGEFPLVTLVKKICAVVRDCFVALYFFFFVPSLPSAPTPPAPTPPEREPSRQKLRPSPVLTGPSHPSSKPEVRSPPTGESFHTANEPEEFHSARSPSDEDMRAASPSLPQKTDTVLQTQIVTKEEDHERFTSIFSLYAPSLQVLQERCKTITIRTIETKTEGSEAPKKGWPVRQEMELMLENSDIIRWENANGTSQYIIPPSDQVQQEINKALQEVLNTHQSVLNSLIGPDYALVITPKIFQITTQDNHSLEWTYSSKDQSLTILSSSDATFPKKILAYTQAALATASPTRFVPPTHKLVLPITIYPDKVRGQFEAPETITRVFRGIIKRGLTFTPRITLTANQTIEWTYEPTPQCFTWRSGLNMAHRIKAPKPEKEASPAPTSIWKHITKTVKDTMQSAPERVKLASLNTLASAILGTRLTEDQTYVRWNSSKTPFDLLATVQTVSFTAKRNGTISLDMAGTLQEADQTHKTDELIRFASGGWQREHFDEVFQNLDWNESQEDVYQKDPTLRPVVES